MLEQLSASKDEMELALENLENARKAHQRYIMKQQEEDFKEAIENYVSASMHNPELPEAYYRLAFLMWEKGEIDVNTAIEQCDTALQFSPKCANACIYKGYFNKLADNYEAAEVEFKKAINLAGFKSARPRMMLALSILKRLSAKKASFKDLLSFLYYFISGSVMLSYDIPSLKILTHSMKDDISVIGYEKAGNFLEKFKMLKAAKSLYEIAAKKTGHKDIFYTKIGDICVKTKDNVKAYEAFKTSYDANPKNDINLMKLASLTQTYFPEMVDDTIDYYTELLALKPEKSGIIYYELGHLYLKKEDKINSVSAFKLALEQEKTNPFYHNSLAFAYLKAELYEDAINHYNMAISINPDNEWTSMVCHALGSLYAEIYGNFELAIEKYHIGIDADPKNYAIKLSLGDALMAKGDVENAIRAYCDAISCEPDNFRAYSKAGLALWENDMIEEAMVALHKSIDLNPNFDIAQNNLGVIYLDGLGCASDALPFFVRALEINPSYTLAYFNAGRANEMLGDKTQAAQYYQMALDMNSLTEDLPPSDITERLHSLFEL
ncbi:tetratricopeptide repeat protein [bacterium]|nr:tetratricopeptide repeat protein [bacterium]